MNISELESICDDVRISSTKNAINKIDNNPFVGVPMTEEYVQQVITFEVYHSFGGDILKRFLKKNSLNSQHQITYATSLIKNYKKEVVADVWKHFFDNY